MALRGERGRGRGAGSFDGSIKDISEIDASGYPEATPRMAVFRYLLFNKPFNVLSQFTAGSVQDRKTLADYIPVPDIYPVGRLDFDSEGLMLLTDDGVLKNRLSDPRFGHPRTYWVQVEGLLTEDALKRLEGGIAIQDYRTAKCDARLMSEPDIPPRNPPIRARKNIPVSWLELTLREGRNRQVRRMTAAVGFPTLRLIRAAIGHLTLAGLAPGTWRDLTAEVLGELLASTGHSQKRTARAR